MSTYPLLTNQTVTQSAPPPVVPIAPPGPTNPTMPPQKQTFHLVITGSAGNVSGTAQIVASNDGQNWVSYGDPITAASAYLTAQAAASMDGSWKWFGAYLTAISGTGAVANLTMNA